MEIVQNDSLGALLGHLRMFEMGWTPYQCVYCRSQTPSVTTCRENEESLRLHVQSVHPPHGINGKWMFIYHGDEAKERTLKQLVERSSPRVQTMSDLSPGLPNTNSAPPQQSPPLIDLTLDQESFSLSNSKPIISDGRQLKATLCGHVFCSRCLDTHMQLVVDAKCPKCCMKLTPANIIQLYV